jgi:hypothetical protein
LNQPSAQSSGAYNSQADEVIFYNSGAISSYSRSTGTLSSTVSITGLPVPLSNLNGNSVGYSGISGAEVAVFDRVLKQVYFIDISTGAYAQTVQLPSNAPTPSNFNMSFANGRIFLSDCTNWQSYILWNNSGGITATDNCSISSVLNDYNGTADASDFYPVGTTTVTWTATDASGNTTSCTMDVTVTDNENPTIACPADVSINTDAGTCDAQTTVAAPVTADNCSVASVVNDYNGTSDASDVYPLGTTTVVWTVTDGSGNTSTCSMNITVTDN